MKMLAMFVQHVFFLKRKVYRVGLGYYISEYYGTDLI
jgi:hypothetical protein